MTNSIFFTIAAGISHLYPMSTSPVCSERDLSGINLAVQKKTLTLHPLEPAKPLNDAQMAGRFFYDEQQESIPEAVHLCTRPRQSAEITRSDYN